MTEEPLMADEDDMARMAGLINRASKAADMATATVNAISHKPASADKSMAQSLVSIATSLGIIAEAMARDRIEREMKADVRRG